MQAGLARVCAVKSDGLTNGGWAREAHLSSSVTRMREAFLQLHIKAATRAGAARSFVKHVRGAGGRARVSMAGGIPGVCPCHFVT